MLIRSLEQIMLWTPERIQGYCRQISKPLIKFLQEKGFAVEEENYRAAHLFGLRLPHGISSKQVPGELQKRKIFVSVRGDAVRISPHVYNTENDIEMLMEALERVAE
jgi:selenocysteine lyase/cysteine desulfurase